MKVKRLIRLTTWTWEDIYVRMLRHHSSHWSRTYNWLRDARMFAMYRRWRPVSGGDRAS